MAAGVPEMLAGLLGVRPDHIEVRADKSSGADFLVSAAGRTFLVEFKKSVGAAPVAAASRRLREAAMRFRRRVVPLLAVPFMGGVGRRLCEEAGVGWIDLSGNAHIVAPGLRVIVDGRPNRFRSVGRPPSLFAPKSSRVVRWLLIHFAEPLTQRRIARATDMTEGFVSRIVSGLERDDYLVRDEAGAVRPKDPGLLLDAWREAYQFSKHTIRRGHVAARSGDALCEFVSHSLEEQGMAHAATGLAAAWAFTRFAAFRIATVYLATDPSTSLLDRIGYRDDPRGANIWLVVPNDAGVFHGAVTKGGIQCVHPVQAYVDLKEHPERAPEAAERLRAEMLNWKRDG
ncbi:MAG: hypothetical protein AB1714_01505 [Acidobacteriota bacterium]